MKIVKDYKEQFSEEEFKEKLYDLLKLIESIDPHIINLMEWIGYLETFICEIVRPTEYDKELENEIGNIIKKLESELGHRVYLVLK